MLLRAIGLGTGVFRNALPWGISIIRLCMGYNYYTCEPIRFDGIRFSFIYLFIHFLFKSEIRN